MSLPHLLLVEDDASIRRLVAMALEEEPVHVVQAASLAEAVSVLQTTSFAVVMCDLFLPDGSGHDLLQGLSRPGSPSAAAAKVVFSAGVSEAARAQLLRQGIFRVLSKPASLVELQSCTRQALLAVASSDGAAGACSPAATLPTRGAGWPPEHTVGRSFAQPGAGLNAAAGHEISSAVAHYFGGDFRRYVDFDRRCRVQFSSDIRLGDQALGCADLAALHRLAHSLKSVLQCLGQGPVSELAARLEAGAGRAQMRECKDLWDQLARWLRAHAAA